MALLTQEATRELLDPVQEALLVQPRLNAIRRWAELVASSPLTSATFTTTTRANIIHDLTCHEVRKALPDNAAAREIGALGFFALAVGTDVVVRFKFVPGGFPSNVQTERQELLRLQQYDADDIAALSLEGLPYPPTLVTCGYTLGLDGGAGVLSVQCDYAADIYWRYPIWGDADPNSLGRFENQPLSSDLAPAAAAVRSTREAKRPAQADDR